MLYMLCYIGAKYHIVVTTKLNLFLRKSIKLLPPELLLAQICTKSFGFAYSAPPDPLAGLRRPTSKGRGGKGRERKGREGVLLLRGGEVRRGRGRGEDGRGGERREKEGEGGEGREEGDGRTNPKPAATGLHKAHKRDRQPRCRSTCRSQRVKPKWTKLGFVAAHEWNALCMRHSQYRRPNSVWLY